VQKHSPLDYCEVTPSAAITPAAMARTVWVGKATVIGTGRSSRTRRCRHFARHPCAAGVIAAEGVTSQ